ncbi:hypothetical protein ABEG18_15210 [Alsobacter sp. KACC 23698]|uniref:GAD-related domain-containing protein n=1 Tax=Alsobacter sp. KACC 23698 TaxID=3149229 RepID=A0AAU7J9W8_9HYPH
MVSLSDILKNFAISPAAEQALGGIEARFQEKTLQEPAALCLAWGRIRPKGALPDEGLLIGAYTSAQLKQIPQDAIGVFGNRKLVFFITEKHFDHFAGKMLDWSQDKGLFLRPADR